MIVYSLSVVGTFALCSIQWRGELKVGSQDQPFSNHLVGIVVSVLVDLKEVQILTYA